MSNSNIPLLEKICYAGAIAVNTSVTNHQFALPFAGICLDAAGVVVMDFADFGTQITISLPAGISKIFGTQIYKVGSKTSGMVALF